MMIEKRHDILAQLISEWKKAKDYSDMEDLFVMSLSLASECIGYIDAIKEGKESE